MNPPNQSLTPMFANDSASRLGVLSNPNSGGNRKGLAAVSDILLHQPDALHREAVTLPDTAAALDEFMRNGVGVVAINGGDGTIQTVLTALFHLKPYKKIPLLAVLRAGTDSIIARDIGIHGSRDRGLRKLINWVHEPGGNDAIVRRPVIRLQSSSRPQPLYGMIFGAAVIYQGILFCRRNIHTLGVHGALAPSITLARFLLGVIRRNRQYATPVPLTIELDQAAPIRNDFIMVLVSTVERLFLGLRPYWGTQTGPLHFTAIADRAQHLMRVLPSMARGQRCRLRTPENGYFSDNANEVRLKLNSGFMLDGELHPVGPDTEEVVLNSGGQASFLRL
jgi:diacylglycerol kinase family enzyme